MHPVKQLISLVERTTEKKITLNKGLILHRQQVLIVISNNPENTHGMIRKKEEQEQMLTY